MRVFVTVGVKDGVKETVKGRSRRLLYHEQSDLAALVAKEKEERHHEQSDLATPEPAAPGCPHHGPLPGAAEKQKTNPENE